MTWRSIQKERTETMRKIFGMILLVASLGFSGCAAVLLGAGAAGGYALSKDSVKNNFDMSKDRVYKQSLGVAKEMGQVTSEDSKNGRIEAKVKEIDVVITVKPLTKKTVELKVSGRNKFKMPAVDVAQEVYTKIVERLDKGWSPF